MININNDKPKTKSPGPVDTVNVNPQAHILIKDRDTNKIILNKRG